MKIQALNFTPISYKGTNKEYIISYDDPSLKETRNIMREHLLADVEAEENMDKVLEEWEFNKMVNSLVGIKRGSDSFFKPIPNKSSSIIMSPSLNEGDGEFEKNYQKYITMDKMPAYNVEPLYGTDSYRGSMPEKRDAKYAGEILKQAGIETVIDLVGMGIEKEIKSHGLDYVHIPSYIFSGDSDLYKTNEMITDEIMGYYKYSNLQQKELDEAKESAILCHKENLERDKKQLIDFIKTMQKDNIYVGCDFGKYRTDWALTVNYFLNPKAGCECPSFKANEYVLYLMSNLYENLNDEDKIQMGWTKEFDENFLPKLQEAMDECW